MRVNLSLFHARRLRGSVRMLGVLIFVAATIIRAVALDEPLAFTVDLPFQTNAATPVWLGHPATPSRAFATVEFPINPPDATSSLLVTAFFTEKAGGFLRVLWQPNGGSPQLLSDNFYEGTNMSNQRGLLIAPTVLSSGGTLSFQCGDQTLSIQRVRFEWLENKDALVSPRIEDTLVTPLNEKTLKANTLSGDPATSASAAWHGSIVSVPVTDAPERIEQGVEFNVQLDSVPTAGRLSLAEEGLPWGKRLAVWVNQQRAGTITPGVPTLADDGFMPDAAAAGAYVGWREGSIFLPVSLLKSGVNALQFTVEDENTSPTTPAPGAPSSDAASSSPLAVKNVVLELAYPPAADNSASIATVTADSTNNPAALPPPVPADSTNTPASTSPVPPAP